MRGKLGLAASVLATAAFGVMSFASVSGATGLTGPFKLCAGGKCNTNDVVYVSRQALPAGGLVVTSQGVVDNDTSCGLIDEFNKVSNGDDSKVTLKYSLDHGSFAVNSLRVIVDNSSGQCAYEDVTVSGGTATFTFDNSSSGSNNLTTCGGDIKSITLVDANSDNETLSIKINGGLPSGGKVTLRLNSLNGKDETFNGGCVDKDLYIVEDQWTAKLCQCEGGVDTDYLVPTDKGVTLQDAELGIKGVAYYNACMSTSKAECCSNIKPSCGLFCNTTTTGGCVMPGICDNETGSGLQIYTNVDFQNTPDAYKVTSLANSTVKFTLKGKELSNLSKVVLTQYDPNTKTFSDIANFVIDNDTTATLSIPGDQLFINNNKDSVTGGIHFFVKFIPKSGAILEPTSFDLSATITGTDVQNDDELSWGTFEKWNYQEGSVIFKVPYVRSDNLISSVIRIENAGTQPVKVSLLVDNPDGNGWVFVKEISVDPGTAKAVLGSDIKSWATEQGITLGSGFAVKGIVSSEGSQDTITVYASQQYKGTTSFRPLPVKIYNAQYSE